MNKIIPYTCYATLLLFAILYNTTSLSYISFSCTPINQEVYKITLLFNLNSGDFIYKNYIKFSIDHPDIILSKWKSSIKPISYYNPVYKNNKLVFNKSFAAIMYVKVTDKKALHAFLYCTYYQHSKKKQNDSP